MIEWRYIPSGKLLSFEAYPTCDGYVTLELLFPVTTVCISLGVDLASSFLNTLLRCLVPDCNTVFLCAI